jgi:regulation of enolase protein 1 (concanavalin A-like superfamily)
MKTKALEYLIVTDLQSREVSTCAAPYTDIPRWDARCSSVFDLAKSETGLVACSPTPAGFRELSDSVLGKPLNLV